jgi:hypothetical protein
VARAGALSSLARNFCCSDEDGIGRDRIANALIEPGFIFVGKQMDFRADRCSCTALLLDAADGVPRFNARSVIMTKKTGTRIRT